MNIMTRLIVALFELAETALIFWLIYSIIKYFGQKLIALFSRISPKQIEDN